jgi:hypothetical protein
MTFLLQASFLSVERHLTYDFTSDGSYIITKNSVPQLYRNRTTKLSVNLPVKVTKIQTFADFEIFSSHYGTCISR